jgi:hypothetical protein
METAHDEAVPRSVPLGWAERLTAWAVAGAVIILFVFYAGYLARNVVPLQAELDLMAARAVGHPQTLSAVAAVWGAWAAVAGSTLPASRLLSVLAAVASLVVFLDLARIISRDRSVPPFLALAFVIFPPFVAAVSTATPHGLIVLLMLGALRLLAQPWATTPHGVLAGVLCALASLLAPMGGAIAALWLVYGGVLVREWRGAVVALSVVAVTGLLAAILGLNMPAIDTALASGRGPSVLQNLVLPYAMVPVAALLSTLAMFSARVRSIVGIDRASVAIAGPFAALAYLLMARSLGFLQTSQLTLAMATCVPFVLFAAWPLAVWVRHVMPQIRSFWAWVAFPVVMYSCFWVVLGPIKSDRFPYTHLQLAQPEEWPVRLR